MQILTRDKSEDVDKHFKVETLRKVANSNFIKLNQRLQKKMDSFKDRNVTIHCEKFTQDDIDKGWLPKFDIKIDPPKDYDDKPPKDAPKD